MNNICIGENGHIQYDWSDNIREKIVQFNFQLVRDANIDYMENKMKEILNIINNLVDETDKPLKKELLTIMFKLIIFTRDIIYGKGECKLSYMMIKVWYDTFKTDVDFLLCSFFSHYDYFTHEYKKKHTIGSWKDIKYFCNYCIEKGYSKDHILIDYLIEITNMQLKYDHCLIKSNNKLNKLSLAAKWIPREKSRKFGWLFKRLAYNYYKAYFNTNTNTNANTNIKAAKMHAIIGYRKLLSEINAKLKTTQIYQCNNEWTKINFDNVTSQTLQKQKNAFYKHCPEEFIDFVSYSSNIYSFHVDIGNIVQEGIQYALSNVAENDHKITLINKQWNNFLNYIYDLEYILPIVDISFQQSEHSKYVSLGLAILMSQKSSLKSRILTFTSQINWFNIENCKTFYDIIKLLINNCWDLNSNFDNVLDFLKDGIINNNVHDLILVIFSNMQFDNNNIHNNNCVYQKIKNTFKNSIVPQIVFWNTSYSNGFPCNYDQKNVSMVSGVNSQLINNFKKKSETSLHYKSCTPWTTFKKMIDHNRYKDAEDYITKKIDLIFSQNY